MSGESLSAVGSMSKSGNGLFPETTPSGKLFKPQDSAVSPRLMQFPRPTISTDIPHLHALDSISSSDVKSPRASLSPFANRAVLPSFSQTKDYSVKDDPSIDQMIAYTDLPLPSTCDARDTNGQQTSKDSPTTRPDSTDEGGREEGTAGHTQSETSANTLGVPANSPETTSTSKEVEKVNEWEKEGLGKGSVADEDLTPQQLAARQRGYARWQRACHGVVQELKTRKAQQQAMQRYGQQELSGQDRKGKFTIIALDSDFRIGWDLVQVIVLAYVALLVPFRVCFIVEVEGVGAWIDILVDSYFVVDILVNFVSEVRVDKDMEVHHIDSHREIAYHYLRGWFALDLIATLPLDYIMRAQEGTLACSLSPTGCSRVNTEDAEGSTSSGGALKLLKLLRVFRLLKLVRLVRISRIIARYEYRLVYWLNALAILKVVGVTTLFSHWMGCFYGMVFDWESADGKYMDDDVFERWVRCFYWAIQTTTTVGYGDMISETWEGQLVSVVVMMVGGVLFSWFMSSIFATLNPDPKKQERMQTLQYVLQYLQTNKLPADTAARVLAFYKKHKSFNFDDKQLLDSLPDVLQQEIFELLYARTVRCVPVFMDESDLFVIHICMLVNPILIMQYDIMYIPGDPATDVYIVGSGELSILYPKDTKDHVRQGQLSNPLFSIHEEKTCITREGALFGEEALFGCKKRIELAFVKSITCKMLKIPIEPLVNLLKTRGNVRESMMTEFLSRLISFGSQAAQRNFLRQTGMVKELMDDSTGAIKYNWKQIIQDKQIDPWGFKDYRTKAGRRASLASATVGPGVGSSRRSEDSFRVRKSDDTDRVDRETAKRPDALIDLVVSMKEQIRENVQMREQMKEQMINQESMRQQLNALTNLVEKMQTQITRQ